MVGRIGFTVGAPCSGFNLLAKNEFRDIISSEVIMSCIFCNIMREKFLFSNEHFYVIDDKYPVAKGHLLVIPFRHFEDFFAIEAEEMLALRDAILHSKTILEAKYAPEAYNIGMNCGHHAGQSVFHFHVHIIPRYKNDRKKGGIQKTISGLREYLEELI